jgi:phenylpyruvate tautomerase PptA (4-oxalocrotonate tautomerase family)
MLHELADGHYLNAGRFGTPGLMFVVDLIEGRSEEQKAALILSLHKVGVQAGSVPENEVRVRLIDFSKSNMGMAGGVSAKALAG